MRNRKVICLVLIAHFMIPISIFAGDRQMEMVDDNGERYWLTGFSVRSPLKGDWVVMRDSATVTFGYRYSIADDSVAATAGLFDIPFAYSTEHDFLRELKLIFSDLVVGERGVERFAIKEEKLVSGYGSLCFRAVYKIDGVSAADKSPPEFEILYHGLVCVHPDRGDTAVIAGFSRMASRSIDEELFRREAESFFDGIKFERLK